MYTVRMEVLDQQTARELVTWELRKPVPDQYACRNLLGQKDPSSNVTHLHYGLRYAPKMKVVQTLGSRWIEDLNTLRNHYTKLTFIL